MKLNEVMRTTFAARDYDGTGFGDQIAYVAIGSDHFIALAQIFFQGLGFGRRFDN